MQLRKPWTGAHGELHGVWIGNALEIEYRARRGKRRIRIVPEDGGVRVISELPDKLLAETMCCGEKPRVLE